jgi:hypothetical protein
MNNFEWLLLTIILTPLSSLFCCWIGILLGELCDHFHNIG